jgi:hypothetical protein
MVTSSIIYFLNTNSGAIEAIATIVLVAVTTYYAIETAKMRNLMSSQGETNMLPLVIGKGFTMTKSGEKFCVECNLKNLGNGLALSVLIEFYDPETKKLVMESEHYIDFLEKNSSEPLNIHIPVESISNLRYETYKGKMVAELMGIIKFHNIRGRHYSTQQIFMLEKKDMTIKPVHGSFKFKSENHLKKNYLWK